ncbi:MAG TPA: hypothetical protein VF155_02720 [Candidatus Dormibacteraeota bacterium]
MPRDADAAWQNQLPSFIAGARIYAPLGAWLAVAMSLAVWLAANVAGVAPLVGLVAGAGVVVAAALVAVGARATWNRARCRTLTDWSKDIGASAASNPALTARLQDALEPLDAGVGPQWMSGDGYVSVSRSLSEIEVAAMDGANATQLLDSAQIDKMRLGGSSIDSRDALLADLNDAIKTLTTATASTDIGAARSTVKRVRGAVNDYRDTSRESLARLRQKTLDAVALAGSLSYLLTIVGTASSTADQRAKVASGAALFLVAAIVGVVAALNGMSTLNSADDDFGLATARLLATAVLSGLAGVAGVLLVYLSGAANALSGAAAGGTAAIPTDFNNVFDVTGHPVTLIVTAIFGATPSLLITSLSKLGDKYASGLTSTKPTSTTSPS